MVAVIANEHKVLIWRSADLKHWTQLSEFGPRDAVGGLWECPDLFPLAVDGDPDNVKWVMLVSLNPGGIAGGSGTQYFVGDFDGTTFTPIRPTAPLWTAARRGSTTAPTTTPRSPSMTSRRAGGC